MSFVVSIISIIIVGIIVGFVTSGLSIRFDRFFAIVLLIGLAGLDITTAVNVFLWILLFGSGYVLFQNREKIRKIPSAQRKKFLTIIPLLAFVGVWLGTLVFEHVASHTLQIVLGLLALLYGLRLMFVHFRKEELEYSNAHPIIQKFCGMFGPLISGLFVGSFGTTLKPLKIPFAVRAGHMNMQQVYLGNTITAFFAALFAILFHIFSLPENIAMGIQDFSLGVVLWAMIHLVFEFSQRFFKDSWRKPFQVIIGLLLLVAGFRFLAL